jgi:dynein heavy chain
LAEKRKEIGEAASRLRNGLSKIIETRSKVEEMQTDLEVSQHRGKYGK